jgi:release factor glutamine methyltransferase
MSFDTLQVYMPEEDTFLLLSAARHEVRPEDRVLEVGTGSGTIAAGLSGSALVVGTDINPHAVSCAYAKGLVAVRTDLFSGLRGMFDLVLFNPPYLPTLPEERIDDWLEYALDGGANGRVVIERFAADVQRVLAPRGRILLLVSELTGVQGVKDLFSSHGFSHETIAEKDAEGEMLYVLKFVLHNQPPLHEINRDKADECRDCAHPRQTDQD